MQLDPLELYDDPVEVSAAELVAEYQRTNGIPSAEVDAILFEIRRRDLYI